jgi:hypothetical protein
VGIGKEFKFVQVLSPQSLRIVDIQARYMCQVISYSRRKHVEVE